MELAFLAETIRGWEAAGSLVAGEGIVVGHHEPAPIEGAWRIAPRGPGGSVVARWSEGAWAVERRYPAGEEGRAAEHVFDQLAERVAERHWGVDERARQRERVAVGAVLRTAALLLWPEVDLRPDRWLLAARLRELGIEPAGAWWIADVDDLPPADELVPQLRRIEGGWAIGVEERGAWRGELQTDDEAVACRELFRRVVAGAATTMGMGDERPHVVDRFGPAVRAALDGALAELAGPPDAPEGGA